MGLKGVLFAKEGDKRVEAELKKSHTLQEWRDSSLCYYECPDPHSAAVKVKTGPRYAPRPIVRWCCQCRQSLPLSKTSTANTRTDYTPCSHFLDTLY